MKTPATVLVVALASCSLAFGTPVAQKYIFTTIDNPAADTVNGERTRARGINAAGHIVGDFGRRGFLYRGGRFTTIAATGAFISYATGINNSGRIVGSYIDSSERGSHGFLYEDGVVTTIDVPGSGTVNGAATRAFGINAAGQIVGDFDMTVGTQVATHGYLYSDGAFTIIDFPGAYSTQVFGINDAGDIVGSMSFPGVGGTSGFVYSRGIFTALNNPAATAPNGDLVTVALGINNVGQIVGIFTDVGAYRGFVYDKGAFVTLESPPGAVNPSIPLGINEAGRVVGYFSSAAGIHGFLATPSSRP